MVSILGENYEEINDADAVLWRGDLLLFDASCGNDCKAYMICLADDHTHFQLINYVGYKAGARLTTAIPKAASETGSMNIRLSWLKKNWDEAVPIGSFETTTFLSWKSTKPN